jgi:hypothetical protein
MLLVQHVEFFEDLSYGSLGSLNRSELTEKHQILKYSHLFDQNVLLWTKLNKIGNVTFAEQVNTKRCCLSRSWLKFSCQHADSSRFSCAIMAKQN